MIIYIIRHGKVQMNWPKLCNFVSFDEACKKYDFADIQRASALEGDLPERVYVSDLRRSKETALEILKVSNAVELKGIEEVPLRSFADINVRLPLGVWNVFGRLQWYCNSARQKEGRKATIRRADDVIEQLEKVGCDCAIVTHGFFMKTFVKRLKWRGYQVCGNKMLGFEHLQMITAEK